MKEFFIDIAVRVFYMLIITLLCDYAFEAPTWAALCTALIIVANKAYVKSDSEASK